MTPRRPRASAGPAPLPGGTWPVGEDTRSVCRRPSGRAPTTPPDLRSGPARRSSRDEFGAADCHDAITAATVPASGPVITSPPGESDGRRRVALRGEPGTHRSTGVNPAPGLRSAAGRAASRPNPSANSVGGIGRNGEPPDGAPQHRTTQDRTPRLRPPDRSATARLTQPTAGGRPRPRTVAPGCPSLPHVPPPPAALGGAAAAPRSPPEPPPP